MACVLESFFEKTLWFAVEIDLLLISSMDHGGGSNNGQFQAGSQSEPFFELLHPNTNASYNGSQNSQSGFDFGTDDVLPNFEFQPIVDTSSKMKVGEDHHGWQASPAPNFVCPFTLLSRDRFLLPRYE